MPAQWGLTDWNAIKHMSWPNALVGNGLGISVSQQFSYPSLYSAAGLTIADVAVFDALGTANFERVLDYLRIAKIVCTQMHGGGAEIEARYTSIRSKLIAAVNANHVSHGAVPADRLTRIADALDKHAHVWSTSYDLLPYWAIMSRTPKGAGFTDAFRDGNFEPVVDALDTSDRTRLWFVHGALHIYRLPDGSTKKRQNTTTQNLLQMLGTPYHGVDVPLFVSEGTAADKLAAIHSSEYLSHAYTLLGTAPGPIVIFGQRLDDVDSHLVNAIRHEPNRTIAYGIYAPNQAAADAEVARVKQLFPQATIYFYDSATHPLSS